MPSSIIIALIAAAVSLCATIANVWLAVFARRTVKSQEQWRLSLKLLEEQLNRIRTQGTAAERVRARCSLFRNRVAAVKMTSDASDQITSAFRELEIEYEAFWHSWAEAKDDIPYDELHDMRRIRHELSHKFEALRLVIREIQRFPLRIGTVRSRVLENATAFSEGMDGFFTELSRIRAGLLEQVLLRGGAPHVR